MVGDAIFIEVNNSSDLIKNFSLPLEVDLFDATEFSQQSFPTYEQVMERQKRNNPEAFRKS